MFTGFSLLFLVITIASVLTTVFVALMLRSERSEHKETLLDKGELTSRVEEVLALNKLVNQENLSLLKQFSDLNDDYKKLLNQKKSSEVRVGKIGEHLAPFLDAWPYDPNSFRFLGNPIDGIQFADDKIRFIEIKTGGARLSQGQKQVRDLVMNGKVSFVSFRIGTEGCELIEDDLKI